MDAEGDTVKRPNDEGGSDCGATPPKTNLNQHPYFASDSGNALTMMKARAELCGCSLHELADGAFLVARWNFSKAVPCLRAVGDLLRQIGGH